MQDLQQVKVIAVSGGQGLCVSPNRVERVLQLKIQI
jgi:hypothetical protein